MPLIHITAQYYQNYAFSEGGESWKPKGGTTFAVEVSYDYLMYYKHALEVAFRTMVERRSDKASKYEYVGFEIVDTVVDTFENDEFQKVIFEAIKTTVETD